MKTKLLFTTKRSYASHTALLVCLCFNYGWSQTNLALNSTMDEFTTTTNDNSDAWDMSPSSTVVTDQDAIDGTTTPSPYKALWNNSDLDTWLGTNCGDDSEAPGSSSDGNFDYSAGPTAGVATRGVKINEACRRLYQKVAVTSGTSYTLFVESRSESANVPTEVYILNTEIIDETGLASTSTTVDAFLDITNDFSSSKSNATTDNFTKNTLVFTPSGSFVVIYIKSPLAVDSSTEVFFDNIELYETSSLSVDNLSTFNVKAYPNPTTDYVFVESNNFKISEITFFDILGKNVMPSSVLKNSRVDVSSLNRGVYFMKISANGTSVTKKIIIE